MRYPDMPFADGQDMGPAVEARKALEQWQDGHEPALTLRVWLSTTDIASSRLEWGAHTDGKDQALALQGAHQTVDDLLLRLRELEQLLVGAGGERGES